MKVKCSVALVLLLMAGMVSPVQGRSAAGLAMGNLTTADACGYGLGLVGGHIGICDEGTSVFGNLTYGFSDYTEGRVKLGFFDPDIEGADPKIMFGADFKYEFLDYYDRNRKNPFDLAFGGFLEYVDFEGGSVLQIGGNAIISIPYRFDSGRRIIPYGRLNLRMEKVSAGDNDESDFFAGLNAGAKFEASEEFNIYGEFQLDGNAGLFFGVEFRAF
ncbi:MAG: hypothetical protein JW763_06810 [candidate division Zixibacteria bacterium]|nr:hypothetical protein [candidate division Zixibacteria bacterium]